MVGGPDLADCCWQQGWDVRTRANSQESSACATVDISSTAAHKQAPHTCVLRDAGDRDWQLVISPKISSMQNQEQLLEMYHYLGQNGIPEVTLVRTAESPRPGVGPYRPTHPVGIGASNPR